MSENRDDPELSQFAVELSRLKPTGFARRDQTFFEAGQASTRRVVHVWQGVTVAAVLCSIGLAGALTVQSPATVVERVVYLPAPTPKRIPTPLPESEPPAVPSTLYAERPSAENYLTLRDRVVRWGVDALPLPIGPAMQPRLSLDGLLEQDSKTPVDLRPKRSSFFLKSRGAS